MVDGSETDEPSGVLTAPLRDDVVHDALADSSEAVIRAVFSSELLDVIPLVSVARGVYRGAGSVRDAWFDRKLIEFLREFESASQGDLERWRKRIEDDPEGTEMGERVIAVLDLASSRLKSRLAARVFRRYVEREVPGAQCRRAIESISQASAEDLADLIEHGPENLPDDVYARLSGLGLVEGGPDALTTDGAEIISYTSSDRLLL